MAQWSDKGEEKGRREWGEVRDRFEGRTSSEEINWAQTQ